MKDKSELKKLWIGSNGIGVEGRLGEEAVAGNDGGRECQSKWILNVSPFPTALVGAIALADSLREKSHLEVSTFENNDIKDEGALALAHAVSASPRLSAFDLSGNPITPDMVAQIREFVPVLSFVATVSECASLCPGGLLRKPGALHTPSNMTCSARETFCLANEGSCGSCGDMQGEALIKTDCCGARTACNIAATFTLDASTDQTCPPGSTFVPGGSIVFPLHVVSVQECTLFPCGAVPGMYVTIQGEHVPDMPCDEFLHYLALHTSCCI